MQLRFPGVGLTAIISLCFVAGCTDVPESSSSPARFEIHSPEVPNERSTASSTIDWEAVKKLDEAVRWNRMLEAENVKAWYRQAKLNALAAEAERLKAESRRFQQTLPSPPKTTSVGTGVCGGDLPPCYVCERESHCTYGIVSEHTGCTGYHCYGKWQFDPRTWRTYAQRLGIPSWPPTDWGSITPAMEDAVARAAWNGGAGCGHWAACNG